MSARCDVDAALAPIDGPAAVEVFVCLFCGDEFDFGELADCPDQGRIEDPHCEDCWTSCQRCVLGRRAA